MHRDWIFEGLTPADIAPRAAEIAAAYAAYGMVVFPGLLAHDAAFNRYLADIRYLLGRVLARHGQTLAPDEDLGDVIVRLKAIDPLAGRAVADLGTQPNKFVSANQLKFSDHVVRLVRLALGEDAVLATPQAGDSLYFFMPGEFFHRYNLPVHQDYQYLMQSPRQTTLYLGLSYPHDDAGGLEVWPGSQKLGVLACDKNANDHYRVVDAERLLAGLPCERYRWQVGDLGLFDSLMCHRSIPNTSADHGRVVQIMRYSDLRDAESERYDWASRVYPRRGVTFEDANPELVRDAATVARRA
jgi:hypothetical protein